jgi:sugar/nucleoside kinase (ribokinase family)
MSKRVWIVGPIAWDSVYYVDQLPSAGNFVQSIRNIERPGGTAANSAIGIASTGIETGFVGYLGDDAHSQNLMKTLHDSGIKNLHMQKLHGPPSHVLIVIDKQGERTIIGLSEDRLDTVTLEGADLNPGDIVVFQLWRDHFKKDLEIAKRAGCFTIVGIEALSSDITADIAIGSASDSTAQGKIESHLGRFSRIVVTHGAQGATEYSDKGMVNQAAHSVKAVDATGAGDAFLAGYVSALAKGEESGLERMKIGSAWAALAVQSESSTAPQWRDVEKFLSR